jgi:hypothetical protein
MKEIIFEILEDEIEGGFTASAIGCGIHTEAETREELERNIREAIDCHFEEEMEKPKIIRLHFVRDEILAL